MFPLRDVIPSRTTPVVTVLIIVLNVLAFLYEQSFDQQSLDVFLRTWGFVPAVFAWPTIFTSMFLHGGLWHLAGNMWSFWIFGDNVEDRFGHGTFLVFYLICGLAATFAQLMVDPGSRVPNLGASGAIAGVLGSYILLFPRGTVRVLQGQQVVQMPALMVIGFWIVLQLFSGIGSIAGAAETGGVAYMAHVGGFAAGCLLTLLMRGRTATA